MANTNDDVGQLKKIIAELEEKLNRANKVGTGNGLDLTKVVGDICIRSPKPTAKEHWRKISQKIQVSTYKAQTVSEPRQQLEDFCRDLIINNDHISIMERRMRDAIDKGLQKTSHNTASVKCFPTFVEELPSGYEVGSFLALDLGGTNFRVVLMKITQSKSEMESEIYPISAEIMTGEGHKLFDHIAFCLASFVKSRGITETLPLGFTFSFPCKQNGLDSGELIKWTKGFSCDGVEGVDVVKLLKEAIGRRDDVKIDVSAILNDTTGCLMSCAWKNPKCRVGMIIGTGTNACYLENKNNIETLDGGLTSYRQGDQMIVNTEWGAFGDQGELDFILTRWDIEVDKGSINPGKQIFEKMISGMYMGEVVRQVLADLKHEGLIFKTEGDALLTRGSFLTRFVSEIESDPVGDYTRCRAALKEIDIVNPTQEDCSALRYVCECVSRRAGFLVSAGITALLKKMDYRDVVVAIDGSVYRYHPHFSNIVRSRIAQQMGVDYKFDLMLSADGSGRGAALVAAVLCGQCPI